MLGCLEETRLRVVRSGRVIYQTSQFNGSWNRVNDEISTAQFVLPFNDDCCPTDLHAYVDIVEFSRNGEVAWAGYIQRFILENGVQTIEAADFLDGYQRRIIRTPINLTNTDISTIAEAVMNSADANDPIPVVRVFTPSGITADRLYPVSDYRIAWDALKNDLLNIGLDITMIGTLLYAGPLEKRGLKPLVLRDHMILGVPTSGEDGSSYANRIIVKGTNGLVSVYPAGAPVAPYPYPLIESVVDANDVADQASLDSLAKQHYDLRSAVPRFLDMSGGVTLKEDSPHALKSYIAGRLIDVGITVGCSVIQQAMRLESLSYSLSGGREEVKISCVPIGTVPQGVLS